MGRDVTITEVMQVSGMSSATLRYYERRGLIESRGRRGGRRLYDPEVFDRLGLIALARRAGFSVEEVAGIVGAMRVSRSGLEARAKVVEELIGQMLALRAALRHAAICGEPSHAGCEIFRQLTAAALKRERRVR